MSSKYETLSADYEEQRQAKETERRRRAVAEAEIETYKRDFADMTASHMTRQSALEKALAKAQAMWMQLEVDLAESQVELSGLKDALAESQRAVVAEREERLRVGQLVQRISGAQVVSALVDALSLVDGHSLQATKD